MFNFHQKFYVTTLIILISVQTIFAGNILFFHLLISQSHRISIWPLAEKLADNGHNVSYIFPMEPRRQSHPKIEEIVPSKMIPILHEYVGDFDINVRLNGTMNRWLFELFTTSLKLCEAFYESPETQQWLARPGLHYDLILIDGTMGECAYGLVHKFKSKHIMFWPNGYGPWMWDATGIVAESASVPESCYFNTKPDQMNQFSNRLLTTLAMYAWRIGMLRFISQVEPLIQKNLNISADEMPDFLDIERNTSLILVNAHFVEDYAVALPPMVQSYSGLWCSKEKLKTRKPLPKDIQKFIGNNSVVYVSLGSAVASSTMPVFLRDQFFSAFEAFPDLRFLWRWTDEKNIPKNTPKNAMLRNWFPQKDIMADSRTKVFITQTGRISTHDPLCHAVPIIAFPILGDQDYNANRLEYIGAAIVLDIENLTALTLQNAIAEIMSDDKYRAKMRELSSLFRDRPVDQLENVFYWTEYVLRHDTIHLRPLGINRYWYERRLLDVYFFLGLSFFSVIIMMYYVFKFCTRWFTCNGKIKND